jgi:hypothetical protein
VGPRARLVLVAPGILALLGGLAGGLARLEWPVPTTAGLVVFHGPLMVSGFLGTVIGLERAVAVGRPWAYAGPVATALGAVALVVGEPGGAWLMAVGSGVMVLVLVDILRRQTAPYTAVMALGACSWLAGQLLWMAGWPIHRVVYWWAGFLVLTIAGERLELTRLLPLGAGSRVAFVAVVGALLGGLALTAVEPDAGARLAGAAMVGLAAWLGLFDVARRNVRVPGVTRFIAVALLSGYVWLGISGLLVLYLGAVGAGAAYDAILHALFLGFVFSMIFGHAPLIVPALLRIRAIYHPALYAPLGLLHASLVLRIVGDVAWPDGRRWGGLVNVLAILAFFASLAHGLLASRRRAELSASDHAGRASSLTRPGRS